MHRSWVGKRMRRGADGVRDSCTMVVDSLWENDSDRVSTSEAVAQLAENLKELEAATKDFDQIQQVLEDTSQELQERHLMSEACKQVVGQFSSDLDLAFPDDGLHRRLRAIAQRKAQFVAGTGLGPYAKQILTRLSIQEDKPTTMKKPASSSSSSAASSLVSTTEAGFSWEHLPHQDKLVLKWTRLMCVTLKLNGQDLEIRSVHITAEGGGDVWPSKFDVFRSMEREARRELRQLKFRPELLTQDEVNARFIAWVARYRTVFQRKCGLTKRHFALGGVGREGQLEARPPLVNKPDHDDELEDCAVFQGQLM
ncbi:hypothetical protein BASA81_001220 [Batrachochytrium salamandrivorans]|nr:hypothetical protein BASA81_001220 [Batrachochytrium salamandrivorans]